MLNYQNLCTPQKSKLVIGKQEKDSLETDNKSEKSKEFTEENTDPKSQQISEFSPRTEESILFQNSASLYIHKNCNKDPKYEENNILSNGYRIDENIYDYQGKIIILRFRNGFLDGDEFDSDGNLLGTRPAVETVGHIEYWRNGFLHRDDKQPAIITNGFKTFEFWTQGKRDFI